MNQKKRDNLIWYAFIIILIISSILFNFNERKEIENDKGTTIGRVTKVSCNQSGEITYIFYYKGRRYENLESTCSGVVENDFYEINFKRSNPKISRIVRGKVKNPMILVQNGIEIEGSIEKVKYNLKNYCDLYINYTYLNKKYSVRTRIHKDSLPCGAIEKCKNAPIPIQISHHYPDLNNLYFESHDRGAVRKKYSID
ncbi:hypothetical protein [Flagellimonas sp. 2504JD4-2]